MLKKQKAFRGKKLKFLSVLLCLAVFICALAGITVTAQGAQGESVSAGVGSPDVSETALIVLLIILIVCEVVGSVVIITLILRSLPKNKTKVFENPEVDEDEQV